MPQLNPAPWLSMFLITWLFIIILAPMKINFYYSNNLNFKPQKYFCKPWLWPWL